MSQPLKKLQEIVPFEKAADVERGILKKHGETETYGPGTFGVEFELAPHPTDDSAMDDMIDQSDPDDVSAIIRRYGSDKFHGDYSDWVMDQRRDDNRYLRSSDRWDDSHGPIDVDTWGEHNPEPERSAYDEDSDFDEALDSWRDKKSEIESDYGYWERHNSNDYKGEFTQHLMHNGGLYGYIEKEDLFGRLFPHTNVNEEDQRDTISEISLWLQERNEEVNETEQGNKNGWGVGTDGDNVEIRSKHLKKTDFPILIQLMAMLKRGRFRVNGGTSAHVHVGLPKDFDYFDLLAILTLVDEHKVKTDAGPDREFHQWAKLRDAIALSFTREAQKRLSDRTTLEPVIHLNEIDFKELLKKSFQKFQGTNISAFFNHGTVEFRYFSSQMIEKPQLFLKWIEYFMLLPAVAKRRNQVAFK